MLPIENARLPFAFPLRSSCHNSFLWQDTEVAGYWHSRAFVGDFCYHTCVESLLLFHLQPTSAKAAWLLCHDYYPSNINTQPPPAPPRDDRLKHSPLLELDSQMNPCWRNPYKNMQAFRWLKHRDIDGEKGEEFLEIVWKRNIGRI